MVKQKVFVNNRKVLVFKTDERCIRQEKKTKSAIRTVSFYGEKGKTYGTIKRKRKTTRVNSTIVLWVIGK